MSFKVLIERAVNASWYGRSKWTYAFLPVEPLIKRHIKKRSSDHHAPKTGPVVIVVGNITVGGTGKTPLILSLCQSLQREGFSVGIVSRGYGGASDNYPLEVLPSTDTSESGDEAKMLALSSGVPVIVDPQRAQAVRALCRNHDVDIVLSDDGLQHYAMARDIELLVVDSSRGFGNGHCLPVGPLREPLARLDSVDFILTNGKKSVDGLANHPHFSFDISPAYWQSVGELFKESTNFESAIALDELPRDQSYLAIAGIGNPQRFFATLKSLNVTFDEQSFPDHYNYTQADFSSNTRPLVMTEKDAVKCGSFFQSDWYFLKVKADLDPEFTKQLINRIRTVQCTRIEE